MPRKVEVMTPTSNGWFQPIGDLDLGTAEALFGRARYVGGVLEFRYADSEWNRNDPWRAAEGDCGTLQSLTVDELKARFDPVRAANMEFRLRPYEEAPRTTRERMMDDMVAAGMVAPDFITSTTEVSGTYERVKRVGVEGELAIRALEVKLAESEGTASGLLETQSRLADACSRANRLSDECGSLRSELNEAYAKIGRQERELERLRRKK